MSVRNRRFVIAGIVVATAVAVPAAALASKSGSPSGTPPSPPLTNSAAAAPGLQKLATSAGISVGRVQAGLVAAKRAGGNTPRGITAFADAARVSHRTAQRIVGTVSRSRVSPSAGAAGKSPTPASAPHLASLTSPVAVTALAARLSVPHNAALHALVQIQALRGQDGVDPSDPAFAAIAHGLGVSTDRLAAGLTAVKHALAGG